MNWSAPTGYGVVSERFIPINPILGRNHQNTIILTGIIDGTDYKAQAAVEGRTKHQRANVAREFKGK